MKKTIIIILFTLFTIPVFAQDKKLPIAVMDLQALGVAQSEAVFVSSFLRQNLVTFSKELQIIDKNNMDRVLEEQGFQQAGCTTQDCAVQMGKLLNVNKMITGNFGILGDIYQITVNVINIESGEIEYSDVISYKSGEQLHEKTKIVAKNIIRNVTTQTSFEEPKKEIEPKPKPKPTNQFNYPVKRVAQMKKIEISTAEEPDKKTGIGFGFPYLSLKHGVSEEISYEGRISYLPGTIVGGGRIYYVFPYFELIKNMESFIGSEISLTYFNKNGIGGFGFLGLIYVGGEYYFSDKFSFCLDIGPVFTKLYNISNLSINVSGIKLVLNVGFNYYFKGSN